MIDYKQRCRDLETKITVYRTQVNQIIAMDWDDSKKYVYLLILFNIERDYQSLADVNIDPLTNFKNHQNIKDLSFDDWAEFFTSPIWQPIKAAYEYTILKKRRDELFKGLISDGATKDDFNMFERLDEILTKKQKEAEKHEKVVYQLIQPTEQNRDIWSHIELKDDKVSRNR